MRQLICLLGLCAFLLPACNNGLETVETQDEYGYQIKYTRRKTDYAKEGTYVKLDEKGRKYEEAKYQNDQLNGERRLYYENGQVQIIEPYAEGNFDGPYQTFYENGQAQLVGQYRANKAEGEWKKYYDSSELMEVVQMRDNLENGPFVEYYRNGNKKAEGTYLNGDNEDGPLQLYDEAGELVKRMDCQRGICRTTWEKEAEQ